MLSNLLNKIKSLALKIYNAGPLLCGVVLGYIFKPELKIIMKAGLVLVQSLLKILVKLF